MTETITDSAGISWRITDPATGRAERVTPLPSRSATRRQSDVVRFFPPVATQAPIDHGVPLSVLGDIKRAMLAHLFEVHPGGTDAIRRAIAGRYPDVPQAIRDEVTETYLAHPLSRGPKRRKSR